MRRKAYTVLGFLVWNHARWYLRRHVEPQVRRAALVAGVLAAGLALAAAGAAVARRAR